MLSVYFATILKSKLVMYQLEQKWFQQKWRTCHTSTNFGMPDWSDTIQQERLVGKNVFFDT